MTLHEYLQAKVSIGVSRFYNEVKDVHLAYQESLEVFKYHSDLHEEYVLFIEDIQPGENVRRRYPEEVEVDLIDAIKQMDGQKAALLLHRFVTSIFSSPLSPGRASPKSG